MNKSVRFAACLVWAAAVQGVCAEGLRSPDGDLIWPQWQLRRSLLVSTPLVPPLISPLPLQGAKQTTMLLGDRYFKVPGLNVGSWGSLRASSGIVVRTHASPTGMFEPARDANSVVPYLGLGYTGLSIKGGWGLNADIGLTAESPSASTRFGRALLGNTAWDSALRELRLSPVFQLGVTYSF